MCLWRVGAVGQNCIGVQRIYVERQVYDEFVKKMVFQTNALKVGDKLSDETDVGPLITEKKLCVLKNGFKMRLRKVVKY